ncbi:hypothetical protein [Paractinoplanes toevensis]|uniref:Uncharacterized protein n=1 Tax=Paractinoplanes toevensis TaxID=571911 RepID=A0A919W2Z9_9ACTN|nr:hypothetical protein [Actinoplanes toevensis]GIM92209.1 hypothetical protein Ato02nite_040020 [Actinoplanes toevensis]
MVFGLGARLGFRLACEGCPVGGDGLSGWLFAVWRQVALGRDVTAAGGPPGHGRLLRPDQRRDQLGLVVQAQLAALTGAAMCAALLARVSASESPPPATGMLTTKFVRCRRIVTRFRAITQGSSFGPGE